jgi:CheY-like chemotaxis protein
VSARRVGTEVELAVRDDGEGIDPALLPLLFERFRQGEIGPSRRHGGLGLGLAIVRHIVERHGGTVAAESTGIGHGSTFRVRLPLVDADEPLAAPERGAVLAVAPSQPLMLADLQDVRVLVVDDEPDANAAVQTALVASGAEVRVAGSAEHALEIFGRWQPDVVVADIGMPGEDGYALLARLRALPPERGGRVPVIALTAFARAEDRVRALAAGFAMHVPKPVDPSDLAAAVARLARGAASRS